MPLRYLYLQERSGSKRGGSKEAVFKLQEWKYVPLAGYRDANAKISGYPRKATRIRSYSLIVHLPSTIKTPQLSSFDTT
jgi:hypothetical protein